MRILIVYGSLEGQTKKISQRIGDMLHDKGHDVTIQSAEQLPANFSPDHVDAAIIGAPIHMGRYPKSISKFVTSHRDWLNHTTTAFVTVCMAIRSQRQESRSQAMAYSENFLQQTGWKPTLTAIFAGAVKYTQYNFITRYIMKKISQREGGSTDTSQDHEYTDWDSVGHFTEEFTEKMMARTETAELTES